MTDIVNTTTGEVTADLTADEARALLVEARFSLDKSRAVIVKLWQGRAWLALGYGSWDLLCDEEFGFRPNLGIEQRREHVAELRKEGMSQRAIAGAVGVDVATISRDLAAPVANATPDLVVTAEELAPAAVVVHGNDGKDYVVHPKKGQPRVAPGSRTDVVGVINTALAKASTAANAADQIRPEHLAHRKDEAATWGRSLDHSLESLHRLRDALRKAST